jgi:hypothetical protein
MDLPFEDKDHVLGRSPFFVKDFAGGGNLLSAMTGKPEAVFKRETVERPNAIEGGCDLFDRRRGRRGDNGGGKHPATSGAHSE